MSERTIIHMVANAHLDPIWLWPWQEGADEAIATFKSAVDRCHEYPELIYTRGESWLFETVERIDPGLYRAAEELVLAGRWYIPGGFYIQPDANLPTEEGWRQQIKIGQRYFQDRFGIRPTVGYLVDSFGHPATLPDLLAEYGYDSYVFARPLPGDPITLPGNVFRWRGTKGAELLTIRLIPTYTSRREDMYDHIMTTVESNDSSLGHIMCFYGFGNHGGGPTKGMIEYILENRFALEGLELRFSHPGHFFQAMAEKRDKLPAVTSELQHTLPGCYTVMQDIKQSQREGEQLLTQAGNAMRHFPSDGNQLHYEKLDRAWRDLAFTQFHDILAGTSIPSAWRSVEAMQGRAYIEAEEIIHETTRRWCRQHLKKINQHRQIFLNTEDESFSGIVGVSPYLEFDHWNNRWLSTPEGEPIPHQLTQPDGAIFVSNALFLPVSVEAGACTEIIVRDDPPPEYEVETDLKVTPEAISNSHLKVTLGASGITQISYQGKAQLATSGVGLHQRKDDTDTWNFAADNFNDEILETLDNLTWVVEDKGPLRASVRAEARLGNSLVMWRIWLDRHSPSLGMALKIHNLEHHRIWQMPVTLASPPASWEAGLPGGSVQRETCISEWPFQGWVSAAGDGCQWALITQHTNSVSLRDEGLLQLSLLRSPKMACGGGLPDIYHGRDYYADQGVRSFTVEWLWGKALETKQIATAARRIIRPLISFDYYEGMNRLPWNNEPVKRLWTAAEDRAEKHGRLQAPPEPATNHESGARIN